MTIISIDMERRNKFSVILLTALMLFVMSGQLVHARILPEAHALATAGAALASSELPRHDSHDITLPCPISECSAGMIFLSQVTTERASPIAAIRYTVSARSEPEGARPAPDPLPPKGHFLLA